MTYGAAFPWIGVVVLGVSIVGAAALLLTVLIKLRGNPWYALAAVWGLLGVHARQQASPLPGANSAALVALSLAVLVVLTTLIIGLSHWQARQLEKEP